MLEKCKALFIPVKTGPVSAGGAAKLIMAIFLNTKNPLKMCEFSLYQSL